MLWIKWLVYTATLYCSHMAHMVHCLRHVRQHVSYIACIKSSRLKYWACILCSLKCQVDPKLASSPAFQLCVRIKFLISCNLPPRLKQLSSGACCHSRVLHFVTLRVHRSQCTAILNAWEDWTFVAETFAMLNKLGDPTFSSLNLARPFVRIIISKSFRR